MVLGKIIGHLLAKKLKEKKTETGEPQTEDQEAKTRQVLLRAVRDSLAYKAREAGKKITEIKEKTDDPEQRKVAEIMYDLIVKAPLGYKYIATPAALEILEKKLYKDPNQVMKVLLQTHYYVLREAYKNIPGIHKATSEEHREHGDNTIEPGWAWGGAAEVLSALYYATHDERYKELKKKLREMSDEISARRLEVTTDPDHALREIINKHAQKMIGEPAIPEEEEEEKREEPIPGAKILSHPDRYPTLTQKILLKTLILGELQRENHGVSRDLYRALRNLLTGPLTTANWHPFLTEWFENLERGQTTSPLTHILQKLPIDPILKHKAYQYLQKIEQGTPIKEIPTEEKQAFKQLMEQVKQEIWNNPTRHAEVMDHLAYYTGTNQRDAAKALIGLIDDLTKIYTGEKTPRQVGIERDATQVLRLIQNLQDKEASIDPYQITATLNQIIQTHIQDPLLRKAYQTTIQHYQETIYQVPRNHQYLEKIIEKERELEQKLQELEENGEKLRDLEVKRIAMLYRTLMLLTPHPTLKETKQFYNQIAQRLKIRVGSEEFLPVHGPIAEDTATSFAAIRKAPPEEKEQVIRREIASFEPLLYAAPHVEKALTGILAKGHGKTIPLEEHQEFIKHLERTQMRRPLEA